MNVVSTPTRLSRRDFVLQTGVSLAAACLLPALARSESADTGASLSSRYPIAGFEKHFFEKYSPGELAKTYDEMDLDVELTLRPEGHIKPANAETELPAMVEALAARHRRVRVVATSFVRPDEAFLVKALRAARAAGIEYYRHRGFSYVPGKSVKAQVAEFKKMARDFAAISKEVGMTALYQNHAGEESVGAAIWDIDEMLDDIDPQQFGVALDTRHLMVELGRAWPTALRLISPRIRALYVKSFRWERDRTVETPLADGIVSVDIIKRVLAEHPSLPVCLHVEYLKLQPVAFADREATVQAFKSDAQVLRRWLSASIAKV